MKFSMLLAVATLTSVASAVIPHAAQAFDVSGGSPPSLGRFDCQLGVYLADTSQARNHIEQQWFVVSMAYDVLRPTPTRTAFVAPYLDFGAGLALVPGPETSSHWLTRNFTGIGMSATLHTSSPKRMLDAYAIAGGGLYMLNREEFDFKEVSSDDPSDCGDVSLAPNPINHIGTIHPGFKLGGGLTFGQHLFLEGTYYGLGKLNDVDYSGVAVSLGWRI